MWQKPSRNKPHQGQICIIVINRIAQIPAAQWNGEEFEWWDEEAYGECPSRYVTHWMPFPDDPKEV